MELFNLCSLRLARFNATNDEAITAIPTIEMKSGFSSLITTQLKAAPKTGTRNFQKFSIETLMPGRFNKEYQMVIAAADRKLSQASEYQYAGEMVRGLFLQVELTQWIA